MSATLLLDSLIEQELGRPIWRIRFGREFERDFEARTRERRDRHNILSLGALIVLYDLALIPDWFESPETFGLFVALRLALFTPLCLLAMVLIRRGVPTVAQDAMVAGIAVLTVLLESVRLLWSADMESVVYQLGGGFACLLFVAVVLKMGFGWRVLALTLMTVLKIAAFAAAPDELGGFAKAIVAHAFGSALLILLLAVVLLERAERDAYLHDLRASVLNAQLRDAASTDGLTGLGNRRSLAQAARRRWGTRAPDGPISIVLVDIDHFKRLNDHSGHLEGDRCLRRVADCVRIGLEGPDQAAFRFGGEEILILLPGADAAEARACAERIRAALRREAIPHPGLGDEALMTVSVGLASARHSQMAFSALVGAADAALYEAKRAGRDCIWPPECEPEPAPAPGRQTDGERAEPAGEPLPA